MNRLEPTTEYIDPLPPVKKSKMDPLPPVKKSKMAVKGTNFDPWTVRLDAIASICRLMIIAAIICAYIWRLDIDGSVDAAYQALRMSWLFQHETFEVWK